MDDTTIEDLLSRYGITYREEDINHIWLIVWAYPSPDNSSIPIFLVRAHMGESLAQILAGNVAEERGRMVFCCSLTEYLQTIFTCFPAKAYMERKKPVFYNRN